MAGASISNMSIFSDDIVSKPHNISISVMASVLISDISIFSDDVVSQPLDIGTSTIADTSSDMLISSDDVILTEEDFDSM
ncbi:10366_t:CDS:1, partial [Gigaspora margarita]